jgi:hypothetical protein
VCHKDISWIPLVFNIFSIDLYHGTRYFRCLTFADSIKILRAINFAKNCNLLQCDVEFMQGWCSANFVILNIIKDKVINVTRKTDALYCVCKVCDSFIMRTDTI